MPLSEAPHPQTPRRFCPPGVPGPAPAAPPRARVDAPRWSASPRERAASRIASARSNPARASSTAPVAARTAATWPSDAATSGRAGASCARESGARARELERLLEPAAARRLEVDRRDALERARDVDVAEPERALADRERALVATRAPRPRAPAACSFAPSASSVCATSRRARARARPRGSRARAGGSRARVGGAARALLRGRERVERLRDVAVVGPERGLARAPSRARARFSTSRRRPSSSSAARARAASGLAASCAASSRRSAASAILGSKTSRLRPQRTYANPVRTYRRPRVTAAPPCSCCPEKTSRSPAPGATAAALAPRPKTVPPPSKPALRLRMKESSPPSRWSSRPGLLAARRVVAHDERLEELDLALGDAEERAERAARARPDGRREQRARDGQARRAAAPGRRAASRGRSSSISTSVVEYSPCRSGEAAPSASSTIAAHSAGVRTRGLVDALRRAMARPPSRSEQRAGLVRGQGSSRVQYSDDQRAHDRAEAGAPPRRRHAIARRDASSQTVWYPPF